jgi:hypothetical protein
MDMRSVKHEMVAQEWRQRILSQRESGLSVKKWCASQDIREQKYYYWLHVLRSEELALKKPAGGGFAELRMERSNAGDAFPAAAGICAVIRGQGLTLEIHNGADARTLELAMRALGIGRG